MTLTNLHKAPFPWFGGKSKAAPPVWAALGDVEHYIEPFAGALGVLLNRPHPCNRSYYSETINDLDGFVVNAWRAIQMSPEATADAASWPVAEADKQARQIAVLRWRRDRDLEHLMGDPLWHDPVVAGWWLWATCCQIGAFAGDGPWTADPDTGRIYKQGRAPREPGVKRGLPHLSDDGRGVNHAGTREPGVKRNLPHLSDDGQGVNRPQLREPGVKRDLPHLGNDGQGVNHAGTREPGVAVEDEFHPVTMPELTRWFRYLAARLRHVRIVNGDWKRVCTGGAMWTIPVRMGGGHAGIFLDPPYANDVRSTGLYAEDDGDVAAEVTRWCINNGDNERNRIVLAGYDNEAHRQLLDHGWTEIEWYTEGYLTGGMGNVNSSGGTHQQHRERLWLSPHCLQPTNEPAPQAALF